MIRLEISLAAGEARRFDRFFWSYVGASGDCEDSQISLTAFAGLDGERRIISVETPDMAASFRQAWQASLQSEAPFEPIETVDQVWDGEEGAAA